MSKLRSMKIFGEKPTLIGAALFLVAAIVAAVSVTDKHVASTAPDFEFRTVTFDVMPSHWTTREMWIPIQPEPISQAAADKATIPLYQESYIDQFDCSFGVKEGTVTTFTVMLEKEGSNALSSAIALDAGTAATPINGTLTTTPYSVAAGNKLTVDIDGFSASGKLHDVGCHLVYRSRAAAPEPVAGGMTDRAAARTDRVWFANTFYCQYREKEGTVSAYNLMLESDGTNQLTAAIDLGAAAALTWTAGTLATPYSVASGTKYTVDVDSQTGAGTLHGVQCILGYRTKVYNELQ